MNSLTVATTDAVKRAVTPRPVIRLSRKIEL